VRTAAGLRVDRVHGALFGLACGDALGAVFEGDRRVPANAIAEWMCSPRVLRYTDDTAMALALAEHLADATPGEPIDGHALVLRFARHWRREPWRGYGAGPPRIFARVEDGVPWEQAAREAYPGGGSFGNGGAMRVAPVALAEADLDAVLRQARRSAEVTHAHPLAVDAAAIQAGAVWVALHSCPDEPLDPEAFLARVAGLVTVPALHERLDRVGRLLRSGARPDEAAEDLGNGVAAIESVPLALAAFLSTPDDLPSVVAYAIEAGGDTDTVAAMAGAIGGARVGLPGLPRQWLDRLEGRPTLSELADRLVTRFVS
jgi:poly(ADP-ribose) glycohydrolase ARH3